MKTCTRTGLLGLGLLWLIGCTAGPRAPRPPAGIPPVAREFRAAWVATVANINWPSEPGLSPAEQQRQALAILDTAVAVGLNAIVFQARPQCDALYDSPLEPWSYYLTGEQGQPPDPYYDPLAFWVEAAHERGLELHVWFNPYRAHHARGGPVTEASIVKRHPELVVRLGDEGYHWLDPALAGTQDHSHAVVMDVVRRYDIDGVHFDDYFYPYPSYNDGVDFPDDDSWQAYLDGGGKQTRGDWRRGHVNRFIERLYGSIKKKKRHVKFGLSPFGIWRPGNPPSIQGLDQYAVLYADARLWLREGWVDYWSPQLYWPVNQIPQSYPVLLGWWTRQNVHGRNLWPGIAVGRARDAAGIDEAVNQIMVARGFVPDAPGHIHWSVNAVLRDSTGFADSLRSGPYARPALVPPSPWLDDEAPPAPDVHAGVRDRRVVVAWSHEAGDDVFRWVVYSERGRAWEHRILPRGERTCQLPAYVTVEPPAWRRRQGAEPVAVGLGRIGVSAVDRVGNESPLAVLDVSEMLPPPVVAPPTPVDVGVVE